MANMANRKTDGNTYAYVKIILKTNILFQNKWDLYHSNHQSKPTFLSLRRQYV